MANVAFEAYKKMEEASIISSDAITIKVSDIVRKAFI